MNIDIAESLLETYLHICKNCQIVKNHWTSSTTWDNIDINIINKRKEYITNLINKNKEIKNFISDFYLDKNGLLTCDKLSTIIKQAECDLFGISFGKKENTYYICETAFHGNGLNYSSRDNKNNKVKNNIKVYKKFLGESMVFYLYLAPFLDSSKQNTLYLDFSSPKAKDLSNYKEDTYYKILNDFIKELFNKDNIKVYLSITVNEDYKNNIYIPVIRVMKENNINSELFMRSLKLIDTIDETFNYDDIIKDEDKVEV